MKKERKKERMPGKKGADTTHMSEYEQQRLDNIKRNEEYLKALGFDKQQRAVKVEEKKKVNRKRNLSETVEYFKVEPERRSRRIQQLTPDGTLVTEQNEAERAQRLLEKQAREKERVLLQDIDVETLIDDDENTLRSKVSAPELQQFIEESNAEHYESIGNDVRFSITDIHMCD